MFYRITIDLSFQDEDPIDDIKDKVIDHLDKAIIINPGKENEERGLIQLVRCYHDEDPNKPCELISLDLVPTS